MNETFHVIICLQEQELKPAYGIDHEAGSSGNLNTFFLYNNSSPALLVHAGTIAVRG